MLTLSKLGQLNYYRHTAGSNFAPHGNAKNVTNDYVRVNPDVMARIKEGIDNKQSNIDIYETMVLKDPENVPRQWCVVSC
jgi:hypothetical protein